MADSDARLRFVADQLGEVRRRWLVDGLVWPLPLESAWLVASGRQGAPGVVSTVDGGQALLVTYSIAAQRLAVSERSVDRLVATGVLPVVEVAGAKRIRVVDLAAYVDALPVRA